MMSVPNFIKIISAIVEICMHTDGCLVVYTGRNYSKVYLKGPKKT